jgi:hypothetical protein
MEGLNMMTFTSSIAKNLMMDLLDLAQHENNTFKTNDELFSLT